MSVHRNRITGKVCRHRLLSKAAVSDPLSSTMLPYGENQNKPFYRFRCHHPLITQLSVDQNCGVVLQQGATSKIYLMSNNGKQFLRAELGFVTSGIWVSIDCMNWMNEPHVTRLVGMNPGWLEADKQYCNLTSLMSDEISQNFILCPRSLMKCVHTT